MNSNFASIEKQTIKSYDNSEVFSQFKSTGQTDNLKVVIRVRPALPREMEKDTPFRSIVFNQIIKH
jgi:hypothetical protein